ncbi:MAG: glycogen-binding domain-containing protein [Anaerolineae bacterium]|nr:glycogen-binding domain-containing protein [Anaerolineae bacterium]
MKKSADKQVRFELEAEAGSAVAVAGTFNDWDPTKTPMKENPDSGKFATAVKLASGRHEYKFVVNGEWRVDPNCPEWTPNDCGSLNSVVTV